MQKDPDQLVDLTTTLTDFEAQVIVTALDSRGIPARAFTTAGVALQWDTASSQPMRVAVRRKDLEAATEALKETCADSVDIDWNEVDSGAEEQPAPEQTPLLRERGHWRWIFAMALFLGAAAWFWVMGRYPLY